MTFFRLSQNLHTVEIKIIYIVLNQSKQDFKMKRLQKALATVEVNGNLKCNNYLDNKPVKLVFPTRNIWNFIPFPIWNRDTWFAQDLGRSCISYETG